ncbi:hypothetical protein [Streptomyces sp. ODS28]|uniref:hypothetical protein n=1 Tax=Streptomyces sp. ODS28 TaxID=3136688 RepID=UPI0031E91295
MSFEQEWKQIKADNAGGSSTATRLNQVGDQHSGDPQTGEGQGQLEVDDKDLAAVGDAAFRLWDGLGKHGDDAAEPTKTAGRDLEEDFEIGSALGVVAGKWTSQVDTLRQACAHISNHLDYTRNAHAGDEHYIATTFSIQQLGDGFDEGTQGK